MEGKGKGMEEALKSLTMFALSPVPTSVEAGRERDYYWKNEKGKYNIKDG